MFGLSPLVAGSIAAAAALLLSYYWFGIHRRRQIETAAGNAALANMKWRECVGLVLQALGREGYAEEPSSRQPGDGGSEFLLRKDGKQSLLSYKHGTAYRLGEANVRDFANAVQLQGASEGILITLGSSEAFARDIARRYGVQLIDGVALWPKVLPFLPDELRRNVRQLASSQTRRGVQLGVVGSVLLGAAVFVGAGGIADMAPPVATEAAVPTAPRANDTAAPAAPAAAAEQVGTALPDATAPAPSPAPAETTSAEVPDPGSDPATLQVQAAAQAMEEIAALTEEQKLSRRAAAMARVSKIVKVQSANWSTQSTLVLALIESDGSDQAVVDEACRILVQYEELRYSRLQLDPPAGSAVPVRWRQCQ